MTRTVGPKLEVIRRRTCQEILTVMIGSVGLEVRLVETDRGRASEGDIVPDDALRQQKIGRCGRPRV